MKSLKFKLAASVLAITSILATQAQTSTNSDELPDMSIAPTKEVVANENALYPAVREGQFSDALAHSYNNKLLVVYIYGSKGTDEKPEKYTAKQYAEILQKAFGNEKYTNNPTDAVVFYQETDLEGPSLGSVLINGREYETKGGRTNFPPMLIGKHIDGFADAYAKTNNIQTYNPKGTDANGNVIKNN